MDGWHEIQKEIEAKRGPNAPGGDFDGVRRSKYEAVTKLTGRPLIVYCTAFHNAAKAQLGPLMSIDLSDKDGFNEVTQNIKAEAVDVFIHSPGGSPEATESIVKLLRSRFKDIRFIVTGSAKSAATMLALSGNAILMDMAGELGPFDPQVLVNGRYSPAGSIIEQFDRAAKELNGSPHKLPVWIPILEKFAPALLVQCDNFIALSKKLVSSWLSQYMFAGEENGKRKAGRIARHLADEKRTLSHARRVDAAELLTLGAKIERLEDQTSELQQAVRDLHLAIMATLDGTGVIKLFENSEGACLVRAAKIGPAPGMAF
jgi:hypothetical protein